MYPNDSFPGEHMQLPCFPVPVIGSYSKSIYQIAVNLVLFLVTRRLDLAKALEGALMSFLLLGDPVVLSRSIQA